ncbi:MAG: ubiquinone/menaquinone biosynthesis methyltransferase [Alphaproteobacteria bacterium]|nr:ubiquinone/menaquinone biosynthesis methyltransferase [Alphaproteobacteria bacterium]
MASAGLSSRRARARLDTGTTETMTDTHFGRRRVAAGEKSGLVRDLFTRVAGDYDRMNDYMSLGAHRVWKDAAAARLRPRSGEHFLDIAGGSGDLAFRLGRVSGVRVTVADLTPAMLERGRRRALDRGFSFEWRCADAEALPFGDGVFDGAVCAFGLRNVTDPARALGEALRVLRVGGRFAVLEFSRPDVPVFGGAYNLWARRVIPALARGVGQGEDDYRYLGESIDAFADAGGVAGMMGAAGFCAIDSWSLSLGLVGLHLGYKF